MIFMTATAKAVADFFSVMDREGRGMKYHMSKVIFFMGLVLVLPQNTLMLPTYRQITA
ncbi:hypothetical protein [Falsirhodobacter deserti]|uniref:hypothetical protein n=1 Tax=Falsirhodobacter deserti TaxID=1365611 RepID=UPI0013E30A7C|nr:hypothetical protein [Falsirhodobacter deserti]